MESWRAYASIFHLLYESVFLIAPKVFHGAAKGITLSPVLDKMNDNSLYLHVSLSPYEIKEKM